MSKGNPFRSIYVPNSSQELLDIAFKRALKRSPPGGIRLNVIKKRKSIAITRIKVYSNTLCDKLYETVKKFPSVELMHPFYKSIMSIWVSIDDYKKRLAKIHGVISVIRRLEKDYIMQIRSTRKREGEDIKALLRRIDKLKKEAYGRIASVIKSLDKDLSILAEIVRKMKKLPDLDPDLFTIVVAGPPNSGKSSFVKKVSDAKVEIASYPFTTKNITFGHIRLTLDGFREVLVQIADTPGLFDRPIEERKEPELLALKAIESVADIILFIFDGSIEAVMNAEEQLSVYRTVKSIFKSKDIRSFIVVINKVDIGDKELIEIILQSLKLDNVDVALISVLKSINIDLVLDRIKREVTRRLN